jgi:flagellar motor switch protein FliG
MPVSESESANLGLSAGPGSQRAAAVLLGLGAESAAQIFKSLDETTMRMIALGVRSLRKAPTAIPAALSSFVKTMTGLDADAIVGDSLLREAASKALGTDVARRVFDDLPAPSVAAEEGFANIANADPESLALLLSREQPQTAAVVLGTVDHAHALAVMKHIPQALRPQILRRLALLETVAPEVLQEVGQALSQDLSAAVPSSARKLDGRNAAVSLLRSVPAAEQSEVVGEIEKDDPDLGAALRSRLFTFDDLVHLTDRDMQTLIREIDMSQLTVALKGAAPLIKDRFLKNMSTRAGQMLEDEIGAMGPVKLAAVEAAQTELVKVAFGLAEQGRISIVSSTDRMV